MKRILSFLTILFLLSGIAWAGPQITHEDAYDPASVDIDGGTIDGTTIGSTTPAAGAFTTLKMTTGAAAGVVVSDGSGNLVADTTPALGTPSSGDLSNTTLLTPPIVGKTTPAELWGSPIASKGPAIINSGFAGTVTATASTTVTFSEAADAILAGYSATNPILGTTLISNSLTRYIVSWTNATTAVVDSAVTWAGTAITSVQLPIATFVDSSGATKGWMNAEGIIRSISGINAGLPVAIDYTTNGVNVGTGASAWGVMVNNGSLYAGFTANYGNTGRSGIGTRSGTDFGLIAGDSMKVIVTTDGNILTGGLTAAGTSAAKVLVMGDGTDPASSPANAIQLWSKTGELTVRDASGNVTTLSPHHIEQVTPDPSVELPWTMHHKNALIGIEQEVDMAGLVKAVEALTGKKFAYNRAIQKETVEDLEAFRRAELAKVIKAELTVDEEVTEEEAMEIKDEKPVLKEGIRKDKATGKYLKKKEPTEAKVNAEVAKVKDVLNLPKWVKDRIK